MTNLSNKGFDAIRLFGDKTCRDAARESEFGEGANTIGWNLDLSDCKSDGCDSRGGHYDACRTTAATAAIEAGLWLSENEVSLAEARAAASRGIAETLRAKRDRSK